MVIPRPICESHMEIISVLYRKFLLKVSSPLLSVLPSQNFMGNVALNWLILNCPYLFLLFFIFFPILFSGGFTYFSSFSLSVCIDISWRKFCLWALLLECIEYLLFSLRVVNFFKFVFFLHYLDIFRDENGFHPYSRDGLDSSRFFLPPFASDWFRNGHMDQPEPVRHERFAEVSWESFSSFWGTLKGAVLSFLL